MTGVIVSNGTSWPSSTHDLHPEYSVEYWQRLRLFHLEDAQQGDGQRLLGTPVKSLVGVVVRPDMVVGDGVQRRLVPNLESCLATWQK